MNKSNQWMVLSLCGLTIAGCMSLEERLASNDAGVRRDAECELIQQAYKKGSQQDRLAAIARVSDQGLLFGLAMKSQENTAKEGAAAVQKLTDASQVLQVAKESVVPDVGATALSKVNNVASYADIAQRAKTPAVRAAAYEKITDQNQLLSIAQATKDKTIKLSAIKRVSDKEKLLPIVFASTSARSAAQPAKHNPDNEKRMMAKKMNMEKRMMAEKMAIEKKMGGAKGSASKPAATATVAATVDAELVDAFIANCSNDAVLIKMVKTYGARLAPAQCAELTKKSANAELKDLVASVADLKIAEQIRTAAPDEYTALLDSISNPKIRSSACAEILMNGLKISKDGDGYDAEVKHGIANVRFARGLLSRSDCTMGNYVKYLTDEQLTDIVVMSKLDGTDFYGPNDSHAHVFRQAVVKSVPIEKVIPWLGSMLSLKTGAKSQDERERYRGTCDDIEFRLQKEMPEDQAVLLSVIKRTAGYGLKEKTLNAMFREIRSSEAAEAFLANDYITPADIFCDKKRVFPLMARAMLLVGEPEKKRVVEEAKKHLQEHKGEVCIGPFYLDMPYYEGTLVAEAEKLYSKKGDLVTLYYDNEDPKAIMKDWKKNLRVKKIAFTMKGALKYLDCEDALVLQQAIKQCVKKESGNATALDYLGEIKHDIKIDSSTRINLFSPTGTSTDYESEIWTSYSNTRMGVKLLHGKKSGMLILEAL